MSSHPLSSLIACLAFAPVVLATAGSARVARADDTSSGLQLPKRAAAVTKDGEAAIALLKAIEANPESLAVAKAQVDKAWKAIARAEGAKLSGDEEGARLLSNLALEHAKGADALARAADAEKKADEAEKKAVALEEKLERTRTLLAETDARRVQVASEVAKAREAAKSSAGPAKPPATPPKTPATPAKPPATPPKTPATPAKAPKP